MVGNKREIVKCDCGCETFTVVEVTEGCRSCGYEMRTELTCTKCGKVQ